VIFIEVGRLAVYARERELTVVDTVTVKSTEATWSIEAVNVILLPLSSTIELPLDCRDTVGTVSSSVIVRVTELDDEIFTLGLSDEDISMMLVSSPS
jgi:hypothetical protein